MSVPHWYHNSKVPSFRALLIVSAILRIALIVYSDWHDAHSVVKYTDVDYRVFSDAANFILDPGPVHWKEFDNGAKGPLVDWLGIKIGDPYARETYRYTPLLALLLTPNRWIHPSFGKYLFAACDLLNGVLIYKLLISVVLPSTVREPAKAESESDNPTVKVTEALHARATLFAATHLLDPLVFTISTRGSSESLLATLVLLTLFSTLTARWDAAAFLLGLSTHWKIYPVIYGVGCLGVVGVQGRERPTGWGLAYMRTLVNARTIRFTLISAGTFFLLGAGCYAIWGYTFLHEAYLYHLDRLDHRHNFSPYFYLIYLTYPSHFPPSHSTELAVPLIHHVLRSPLTSLVPQLILSLGTGLLFGRQARHLPFTFFVQTTVFVLFNRVCTSQYFLWYITFLPLLFPRVVPSIACGVVWAAVQALWLAEAYKLEFLGEPVFRAVWLRSLLYVIGHAWVLGEVMKGYARDITGRVSS
ncbi:glycosyltransferase family 50 protein [Serpula lacrymans var. lacrymans S7.3]|uniref:GPI mannosyltransferase 1 n=2 Tax=Serpula lacrymans var. lacrymans TaxID=341189 RepID=F8QEN4_SERL3|nr:glycosyltransferase family 50 protein [Serpula lacrymans var. lacrymans S7.9]EGN93290.1 glycosyltransferase family 50 protein [Serpula lacrymans var. lacrymans S7.3]EGO18668.1 glycosyltransferase family 50 protein [Serpula lacrymans var. lacrymans S7.9]